MTKERNGKGSKTKWIIIVAVVLAVCGIGGYYGYRYYQEEQKKEAIAATNSSIEASLKDFEEIKVSDTKDAKSVHDDKVEALKKMLADQAGYITAEKHYEECETTYTDAISKMKKSIIDDYESVINENTLEDIEKIEDKTKFDTPIKNLQDELEVIQKDSDIVLEKDTYTEYETKITDLVKSYNDRIDAIKKAEEEAKRKAEEEARKAEEAAQNYYNNYYNDSSYNNNYSNGNNSNTANNDYNYSYNGNNLPYDGGATSWTITTDENGNTTTTLHNGPLISYDGGQTWHDLSKDEW